MFVIGLDVKIEGDISCDDTVLIIGRVAGVIRAAKVIVDARATVSGLIAATDVAVHGHVMADVFATQLELSETSTTHGRIFHRILVLKPGAYFEGQSRRHLHPLELFGVKSNVIR